MPLAPFSLRLDNGKHAPALRVMPDQDISGLAELLKLPPVKGAVAVIGGAATFDKPEYQNAREKTKVLLDELARLAVLHQLAIVDGGTPYGAMRLVGEACQRGGYAFPLVGVAPSGKVVWNGGRVFDYRKTWFPGLTLRDLIAYQAYEDELVPLDPHHSAFVLVIANEWGHEVNMLARVAQELGGGKHITLLINGGMISRHDIRAHLETSSAIIVLEGSGRLADEIASAAKDGKSQDNLLQSLLDSGKLHRFRLGDPLNQFTQLLQKLGRWP